jgi:U3 small nucleolar RNA-associated protein 15
MKAISTSGATQAATVAVAITSLAATVTGDRIAIGTANGTILVCQKGIPIQTLKRTNNEPSAGTYAFFTRGMNVDPSNGDTIVAASSNKKRKLAKYDIALKQFRYSDALDEALATRIPRTVVAVFEELGKRQGLTIALSNRDEETLEPILSFIVRYITRPRFAALLIGVTNILINIYSEVTGQSEMIDELFAKLQNQIAEEIRTQKVLFRVVGQLDAILATTK